MLFPGSDYKNVSKKMPLESRRDKQLLRGAAGGSSSAAVVMNQIKVVRGARIGKEFIMRLIGQYVDDVKPLLLRVDRADITFFIEDDDIAAAIQAISRRIRDPASNTPITILRTRMSAGFTTILLSEKQLIEECLRKRYLAETHSLDLSEFGLDE
ncbi:unnamed protein product, partial [Gongylonema pulchrum]|uniref:Tap-RNA_bind domain-containing protein n=1 Tax=Gongylonema pulchrum TaxID=637853 RepID=A0A183E9V0_9BILA